VTKVKEITEASASVGLLLATAVHMHANLAIEIMKYLTATEHEECSETAKQSKRGNLEDECEEPQGQRRTVA